MKILVIDDDPSIRELFENMFEIIGGHQLSYSEDGEQGIQDIQKLTPDMVFCDLQMPKVTGIEVLRFMSQQGQPLASLPMYMVSGAKFDSSFAEIMMGYPNVRGFLAKPFTIEDITKAVAKVGASPSSAGAGKPGPLPSGRNLRILMVDDGPTVFSALNQALGKGDTAQRVTTSEEAVRLVKDTPWDLFIVKMVLPKMCGIEFLRITSADPRLGLVPVILMVGGSLSPDEVTVLQKDFRNLWWVVSQPFGVESLRETLNVLGGRVQDMTR